MSTVAQQLRQAREAKNLTVVQVAEITKIKSDHLRALEEGNFDVFSAPVYIKGFVRTYSTLLKLDVVQVMTVLDGELAQTKRFAEPPPLSDHPRGAVDYVMLQFSRIDWRKGMAGVVLAVIAVVALLGYIGWRHFRAADPLKGLKPGMYQSGHRNAGETLPLPAPKR